MKCVQFQERKYCVEWHKFNSIQSNMLLQIVQWNMQDGIEHVVWLVASSVLQDDASVFRVEDETGTFLRKAGKL